MDVVLQEEKKSAALAQGYTTLQNCTQYPSGCSLPHLANTRIPFERPSLLK
jgi:hypothetical protein